jgi:hypothetical protein
MNQQGYKIMWYTFDDAGDWCCRIVTDQQSQHAVSAVTPQRAIINIASAGSVTTNELAAGTKFNTLL